ncbi:MAG TPA: O-antigen polymerase [Verrucomicrobiae bacterium]|nr:O-antigen polymerase [Verrucomicrobiae bacterium]
MNVEAQDGHLATPLSRNVWLAPIKVGVILACVLLLCLLNSVGILPRVPPAALLLTIMSAGFLFANGRGTQDLIHPVRVFGVIWCFCLALASLHLLPMNSNWSPLMWTCVLTGLISFVGGFWIANEFVSNRQTNPDLEFPEAFRQQTLLSQSRTLVVATFCIAVGISVLSYEYHLIGGIPILSDNPDATRMVLFGFVGEGDPRFDSIFIKIIHLFVEFSKYGVFLAFIVLIQEGRKTKKVVLSCLFLVLLGTLAYGSQAGRTFIINIAVTCIVLFHYLRRRIKLVELGAVAMILFLFLGLFGSWRTRVSESAPLLQRVRDASTFPEGQFWDGVVFGYLTLTESFEVFDRLTVDLPTVQKSSGTLFYAFHRFIPRTNITAITADLYSALFITPTFLGEFYADYGYIGVLLGPLILGCAYAWAYSQRGSRNAIYWVYVRAMLVSMVVFFPYVNLFSLYVTWISDLMFMYLISCFLNARKARYHRLLVDSSGQAPFHI